MTDNIILICALVFVTGCGQKNQVHTNVESGDLKGSQSAINLSVDMGSNSKYDSIISSGNMHIPRAAHTATLLKNGTILICGGFTGNNTLSDAEIYDPASKTFKSIGKMVVARAAHSATLLPDGKVLIAGGYNGGYLSNTEIFDPQSETFSPGPTMKSQRSGHTASLLKNEKILFAGGVGAGWSFLASAEMYDCKTETFSVTSSMTTARESHTATILKNGRVLITGGHKGRRENIKIYASAEIFDPASGKFRLINSMTTIRHKHDAVMLANGKVLITGGSDERDSKGAYSSAEMYDPVASSFRSVKNMNFERYKLNGTSLLLSNNNVLVGGGANRAEVYNSKTGIFTTVPGNMGSKRLFSTATLLPNGAVLITGGYNENMEASAKAWMYVFFEL